MPMAMHMAYMRADSHAFVTISGSHNVVAMGGERAWEARIASGFVMAAGHIVPALVGILEK